MREEGYKPAGGWKGCYGTEPFDLRLTVLRLVRNLPAAAVLTILSILLFGGGYYVKNVLLGGARMYAATSFFRVEYAVDNVEDMMTVYINEMSWNTYLQSDLFLDMAGRYLGEGTDSRELADSLEAFVLSDLRVPSVRVTTDSAERTEAVIRAVEEAMTRDFPGEIEEIASVRVIDSGQAQEVIPDVRPERAFLLSGVLGCFFAVTVLLLKETGDDSIWLPASVWKRYGIRCLGTMKSPGLEKELKEVFPEGGALCTVQAGQDPEAVLESLRRACPKAAGEGWYGVASPLEDEEAGRKLQGAAGVLLAVKAGAHAGKQLEYAAEYLEQRGCAPAAVVLWDADERLIRQYYFGRK